MHWYNGGIVDAIQSSKQKGAIFVVYIEGKDDKSTQITNLINNSEVASRLETNKFVAVKLEAESVSHQQFSEIFNATAVPSIYFIGKDGKTLDIVTEGKDVHDLVLRIDGVLRKAGVTGANSAMQSDSLIKGEQSTSTPPDVVCENGVCTIKKSDTATSEALTEQSEEQSGNSALSPEEKLVKAKELLEKQRLIKQKEEEEKERQREIERRKVGQNVQQMKRWQEDEELKQVMEEREREKRDNQAARNRVLAQIAQDKAERAAKFSPPASSQAKPSTSGVSNPSKATTTTNVAKLQFKLPDGQTHTHEFPSSDALDVVVTYIKATLNLPFSNFTLSTTFPRREFTANDYSMSLADLQLVPNAVILILPLNQGTVSTAQGTNILSSFLWTFVAPFVGIYNFLRSFILGTREDPTGTGGKRQASSADSSGSRSSKSVTAVSSKYDLESKLKEAGIKLVVIDFFATWCGPCKMIAPQLQELAREFPYVVFLKVDVDQNADIARSYGVSAMPTFVFIKNKRTVTTFSGADYYQLRDTIVRYK